MSVSHNFNVDQIILKSKVLNSFLALHFLSLNWLLSVFIFPFVLSQPSLLRSRALDLRADPVRRVLRGQNNRTLVPEIWKQRSLSFYLFTYLWLDWVFIPVHRLSLVALSRGYFSSQCEGFSLWWLLLWSTGSRVHRLQLLWHTGSVVSIPAL